MIKPEKIAIAVVWMISINPIERGWESEIKIEFKIIMEDISNIMSENSLLKY